MLKKYGISCKVIPWLHREGDNKRMNTEIFSEQSNRLTQSVSKSIKGLSALEIMMGHLGIATGFFFLYPNRKAGILFVGIFFMLSGYGLMHNFNNQEGYLNHFLRKRLLNILVPAYMVYIIWGCLEGSIIKTYSLHTFLEYILLREFWLKTNWYLFEIAIFYVVFYCLYKFFPKQRANVLLVVMTIIFVAFFLKIDNPWYGSSICFPFGILYEQYGELLNKWMKKCYWLKCIVTLVICGLSIVLFFVLGNDSIIGNPLARNIAALSFCIWLLFLLDKIKIDYSLCKWFGNISYEIFLFHPMWINIISYYTENPWILLVSCIFMTLLSSILFHGCIVRCCKIFSKS